MLSITIQKPYGRPTPFRFLCRRRFPVLRSRRSSTFSASHSRTSFWRYQMIVLFIPRGWWRCLRSSMKPDSETMSRTYPRLPTRRSSNTGHQRLVFVKKHPVNPHSLVHDVRIAKRLERDDRHSSAGCTTVRWATPASFCVWVLASTRWRRPPVCCIRLAMGNNKQMPF